MDSRSTSTIQGPICGICWSRIGYSGEGGLLTIEGKGLALFLHDELLLIACREQNRVSWCL